jgi:hypothetical protein
MDPTRQAWFDRARAHPVEGILAKRGFKLPLGSKNERKGPCPRCGGDDRFGLSISKQTFTCHQCGLKGAGGIDIIVGIGEAQTPSEAAQILEGPPPKPNGHDTSTGKWVHEGEWFYEDADGSPYLKVVRYRKPDGEKVYPQYHIIKDGQWAKGKPAGAKVPYRLPELLDADRTEPVFIVEGEKCADRLAKEGVAVTSASEGAGKWTSDLNEHFRDRIVWILPDADEPGRKHARRVAANLHGIAREVRIVEISGLNEGHDVFDFLEGGGTGNDLRDLGERVPLWQPPPNGEGISQGPDGLSENQRSHEQKSFVFDPQPYQFPDPAKIPRRAWLDPRKHYMRGVVGASIGAPGRLKSTNELAEFIGMAVGRDLFTEKPLECGALRVAYLNGEENQVELDRWVAAICRRYGIKREDCGDRLWVVSTRDTPIRLAVPGPGGAAVIAQEVVDELLKWCEACQIDVLGVDPLISFHRVRENDSGDMDTLCKEGFGRIAGEIRSVDLVAHTRKSGPGEINTTVDDWRGASSQLGAVRIARTFNFMTTAEAIQLGVEEKDRRLHVRIDDGKSNPGPAGAANWVKIEVENLPNGDVIAVATLWVPPDPFQNVSTADMRVARELAQTGEYRADVRSPKWFGWRLAEHLKVQIRYGGANSKLDLARIKAIIKTWLQNKVLEEEERVDENSKKRIHIIAGSFRPDAADTAEPVHEHEDALA